MHGGKNCAFAVEQPPSRSKKRCLLHSHLIANEQELAILLLHEDPSSLTENDPKGLNALHFAASSGAIDFCRIAIAQIDVNSMTLRGETALHFAASAGHLHITTYLLSKHANDQIKDKAGELALHRACKYGHADVVRLLANFYNVNQQTSKGLTPLLLAVEAGSPAIVKRLLLLKADRQRTNYLADTNMKLAAKAGKSAGHLECRRLLSSFRYDASAATEVAGDVVLAAAQTGNAKALQEQVRRLTPPSATIDPDLYKY
jgi:ankyrin repeat protein